MQILQTIRDMAKKALIFIVEDDNFYNQVISIYLKTKGFDVHSFLSGEDCLEKISLHPDVILLDFMLPGINGLEVMKRMRANNSKAEVIILSGQTDIKIALEAFHEGAYDYIMKDHHAKENALNKIDQIMRYKKICKEKELYKKSIIVILVILVISWIVLLVVYETQKSTAI
jgi:DNA-binding NtrC family response regulator